MPSDVSDALMNRYVYVCNEALQKNKDRFPFKQILGAARHQEQNKTIEVKIEGLQDFPSYVMKIHNDHIVTAPHEDCENCQCDRTWTVPYHYLQKVVENPEAYIRNPAMIDWNWMYDVSA